MDDDRPDETRDEYLARINSTRLGKPARRGFFVPRDEYQARRNAARAYDQTHGKQRLSVAGDRTTGVLACPKCGGTSFKAKRSAKGKLGFGLLAPKSRVRCETCGTEYLRG